MIQPLLVTLFHRSKSPFVKPVLSTLFCIFAAACAHEVTGNPQRSQQSAVVFFYLINETGEDVRLKVSVDDDELFVQPLAAHVASAVPKQAPPASLVPTAELKIELPSAAQQLKVELMPAGPRKLFALAGFPRSNAGFRIIIGKNGISLAQDYYPIR